MRADLLHVSARSAVLALRDGGLYETLRPYQLVANGKPWGETTRVVVSLFGLEPQTRYQIDVLADDALLTSLSLLTRSETATLDARDFGALGDGTRDDTAAIQAAILACPENGRVWIPEGDHPVLPLFLKSHMTLELAKGARLALSTERARFPVLPAAGRDSRYPLGTWEGEEEKMFPALLTGLGVEDVLLCGRGVLDGQAGRGDWWIRPKEMRDAWRGRLLYLSGCRDVTIHGLSFRDSPSWHIHPVLCEKMRFYDICVEAPQNSPNTDGLDPDMCRDVEIAGARFSVGDDCVAIKSGKPAMADKYQAPCERVKVSHCLMENGHGGVTVGSESSGGVRDVRIVDCVMRDTDRGLRVKTRRGRGARGVIDQIALERVRMERVGTPLAVNMHYFCDADGHSPYVQSRESLPVDGRTPCIGEIAMRDVRATDCGACAAYALGLPERPVGRVRLENVDVAYAENASPMPPVMADGVAPCLRRGLVMENVRTVELSGVRLHGQTGERLACRHVAEIIDEEQGGEAP